MIHWLNPAEKTTHTDPAPYLSFLLAEGQSIPDRKAFTAAVVAHKDLWVWVDPYEEEIHGKRVISFAATRQRALVDYHKEWLGVPQGGQP